MYLNLTQIAESFGVSEKVVEDWMHNEGLPHTPDRGRLLFDRAQVANWAADRGLAAKVGFLAPAGSAFATNWRLEPLLRSGRIWRDVAPEAVQEVFQQVVASLPGVTPAIKQLLAQRICAKNGVNFAPIGGGFALPHTSMRVSLGRDSGTVALMLLREPLGAEVQAPDGLPIKRLFFFVAPSPRAHLDLVGRICRMLARGPLRDRVVRSAPDDEIFQAIEAADALASGGAGGGDAR